jgi:hypothetical protein
MHQGVALLPPQRAAAAAPSGGRGQPASGHCVRPQLHTKREQAPAPPDEFSDTGGPNAFNSHPRRLWTLPHCHWTLPRRAHHPRYRMLAAVVSVAGKAAGLGARAILQLAGEPQQSCRGGGGGHRAPVRRVSGTSSATLYARPVGSSQLCPRPPCAQHHTRPPWARPRWPPDLSCAGSVGQCTSHTVRARSSSCSLDTVALAWLLAMNGPQAPPGRSHHSSSGPAASENAERPRCQVRELIAWRDVATGLLACLAGRDIAGHTALLNCLSALRMHLLLCRCAGASRRAAAAAPLGCTTLSSPPAAPPAAGWPIPGEQGRQELASRSSIAVTKP